MTFLVDCWWLITKLNFHFFPPNFAIIVQNITSQRCVSVCNYWWMSATVVVENYLRRDSTSGFVLSTTTLRPLSMASFVAETHFCHVFRVSCIINIVSISIPNVNVNVKNIYRRPICREFESQVPVAEEMLDWVVCSSEQFCFQMCLECGDGSGTFSHHHHIFV